MAQSKWLKGDVVSGAVLAALGVYIVSEAWRWDYSTAEGPGPGFFPLWYGIAMVLLSLVLVLCTVVSAAPSKDSAATDWRGIGRALTVWAAFAVCVALMKPLGFLIALALLTLFVVAVMYGRPLKIALAVAAGNVAGFYLIFGLALQLDLPAGLLGF